MSHPEKDEKPMQACTCNHDLAAYAKRLSDRKVKAERALELAQYAKTLDEKMLWMQQAVKELFEQVFDEV